MTGANPFINMLKHAKKGNISRVEDESLDAFIDFFEKLNETDKHALTPKELMEEIGEIMKEAEEKINNIKE